MKSVPSRREPRGERIDQTGSTADSSDTEKTRRDRPARQTCKGTKGHNRDSWTDDEPFPSEKLDQSKNETN